MKVKKYLVTLRCAILMTNSTIVITASSDEAVHDVIKKISPSSFVVKIEEIESMCIPNET